MCVKRLMMLFLYFMQVLVKIMPRSSDNIELLSTFRNRSNPAYMNALGISIVSISENVPDGMLVFFPSYAVMETCTEFWRNCGIWDNVSKE
jgi:regulator of telomere elongation helicase 1